MVPSVNLMAHLGNIVCAAAIQGFQQRFFPLPASSSHYIWKYWRFDLEYSLCKENPLSLSYGPLVNIKS